MILPLEQQVCSLESSKKLKTLGFSQESLFYWHETARLDNIHVINQSKDNKYCYSAYTVAELGELLPDWIYSQRVDGNRGWVCDGDNEYGDDNPYIECWPDNTEAEVRAKMLIYLKENNLLSN